MKIKDKIKEWLFKDEIEKMNSLENALREEVSRIRLATMCCNDAKKEIEECRKLLTQFVDIGVDVGFCSEEHSWAVICIAGKTEYVKFMPLQYKDAKDVLDFFKRFQYSKHVIDSPFAFRQMVHDRILK